MSVLSNAPAGANASASPIVWRKLSEMWSATTAERAFIGPYELIAFDIPPAGQYPRIIAWEMHTGPNFTTGIAGAPAGSFETAKGAAEQEARRLLSATEVSTGSTRLPSVEIMTFADADAEVIALLAATNSKRGKGDEAEREADFNVTVACELRDAVLTTPPCTLADALAMLNRLACKESGLPCGLIPGEEMSVAAVLLREFVATLVSRG